MAMSFECPDASGEANYVISGSVEQASCLGMLDRTLSISCQDWELARIIHECRREAFETEARRGFSQVRPMQAYWQSVEEAEREKPRRARGSDVVAGIHE